MKPLYTLLYKLTPFMRFIRKLFSKTYIIVVGLIITGAASFFISHRLKLRLFHGILLFAIPIIFFLVLSISSFIFVEFRSNHRNLFFKNKNKE